MIKERVSAKAVLSHLYGRQVEVFYALLVTSGKYTFLPELYDIFGREATIKFLEIFAGCRVKVPKIEKLELLARATAIYVRISQVKERQRFGVIKSLAEEYDLTEDRVRSIYNRTRKNLEEELGFELIGRRKRGRRDSI